MANVQIQKAIELKPATRAAVEAELGRSLRDDEEVSIMAFFNHEEPKGESRRKAAEALVAQLRLADAHATQRGEEELDSALNEALRETRPGYRERE